MTTYSDIRYDMTFSTSATDVGGMVLLATETASASDTIDFTSLIDSTYKEYVFKFIDINPATDNVDFTFQADTGTNTSYNQTMTTTFFRAYLSEDGTGGDLQYITSLDIAQATGFKTIAGNVGSDADQCATGTLHLFNPSNTTFVKHFIFRAITAIYNDGMADIHCAGYFNTTTALTRVRFKMASGALDGTIKMYGVL